MDILKELMELKEAGISLKLIARLSSVPIDTIYNFTRGRLKNLSEETKNNLIRAITTIKEVLNAQNY